MSANEGAGAGAGVSSTASSSTMSSQRKGIELEKFKRRMIRSVARRMKEKKPDDDVWDEMKKEIGSNCKKLWERMRMLTLKKLKRLLEADDRVDLIGPVARMTLTDWLLFDLVIVHEKIDVIDREKLTGDYNSKVLSNLFSLVQRFEIEGRSGENLAEAWTAATVYYNSKGHQCSPMMLQRRWFQIKELTRHKFYKFWFNYRGNQRQLILAKQDSPDDLQKAIALKYPEIITEKFLSWEEGIENRLVILPDELGIKMRQRNLMKAISDTTAPDVVLVEPHIETIDLRVNSDSDDDNEVSETNPPPLVKIKNEPVEEVDEEFDVESEVYIPPEKGSEFEEEIERLQMVEENFDDGALQDDEENPEAVVIDPVPTVGNSEENSLSNEVKDTEGSESGLNDVTDIGSFSIANKVINEERNKEAIVIDDDDDEDMSQISATIMKVEQVEPDVMANDKELVNKDSHVDEATDGRTEETIDESTGVIAEISSVASVGIKVENVEDVIERERMGLDDKQITDEPTEEMLPVISTISSAGIKVERGLIIPNDTVDNDSPVNINMSVASVQDNSTENLGQSDKIAEALPVISAVSSEGVKVEIQIEPNEDTEDLQMGQSNETEQLSADDVVDGDIVNKPIDTSVVAKDDAKVNDLEEFGDISMDLNYADEGIDFADDGIAYVEEDDDDIIIVRDLPSIKSETEPKKEEDAQETGEESTDDEEAMEKTEAQKFDLKLLMYPVVYTTKLDSMTVFDDTSRYEQVYDKESIDKIYALSKPISKQSLTGSEQVIELEEQKDNSDVNNEQVDTKNNTSDVVSDDDLFRSEVIAESTDSESESEVIDVSKRVKLSSYMLQKPKHRSYNPVLLCKNPDFNTRLKKLTVGFFMSARNRTLLQSCMPMTIDMTKAFEDKLINGTLYLKPDPKDSTPSINIIQDDVEVTSAALVKPTAVQQSLMSIDDTLENELKKHMAERIRAINLPDISQVRRLNQHLLTAEVTPLRLQNEKSEITKKQITRRIGPACYIQNIKDDINNLLSQQKPKEVSDTDTNKNTVVTENQPSPPPLVVVNNPISIVPPTPPMVSINTSIPIVTPPSLPSQVSNKSAPSKNTSNSDDPKNATSSITAKARKPHRKTVYPTIAWNRRPHFKQTNQELHQSDALLTIDTLYKMLSALDPSITWGNYSLPKKKNNNKRAHTNEEKQKEDKTNQDTVIDITEDEVQPAKQPRVKPKGTVRIKGKEYCCWCSYRVDHVKGNICNSIAKRRHRCRPECCECCCKDLYFLGDLASVAAAQHLDLQQKEQNISETIEHVVQLVHPQKATKPVADVSIQIDIDNDDPVEPVLDTSSSNNAVLTKTTTDTVDEISLNSSNDGQAELTPLRSISKQPTPKFRVYTGASSKSIAGPTTQSIFTQKVKVTPTAQSNIRMNDNVTPHANDDTVVTVKNISIKNSLLTNADIGPSIQNKTYKDSHVKSAAALPNPCTCRPNISKVNRGRIEINGKNNCPLHKKLIKESKIVLSKKLVTNENQPFFVGKGKILLTNIRMPSKKNQQTFTALPVVSEELAPIPQPPEIQAVSLPAGVQIILLPDQTLTYVIQPDVTLTPEECAILPQFLVAVQQQINAVGITLPVDQSFAKIDEVINLNEDESLNKPESNAGTTESVTEVIETIDSSTNVGGESIIQPHVGDDSAEEITAPKTIEDFEMEIDSIASEKRAKEDEDFEMRIDILAKEKETPEKCISDIDKKTEGVIRKPEDAKSEIANAADDIQKPASDKDTSSLKINEPQSNNADEAINKKSLLSDLMEMSGIMEEDLTPAPAVVTEPQPIILDTQNFVLHREVPREEVVGNQTNVTPVSISVSSSPKSHYTATNKNGNFELTAVTSFAELKYSCDNNGIFFKLDLETGHLTSINVCIQKYPSKIKPNSEKTVIDLTDDPDISISGSTDGDNSPTANQQSIVTLNESSPPNKTYISTILQKKQRLMERLSNNLKPVNILQSKKHVARILKRSKTLHRDPQFPFYSKRKLEKIEAKIDLVDSDSPMEEEYLVSGDSSDDEPLIKKVKRKLTDNTVGRLGSVGPSTDPGQAADKQDKDAPLDEQPLERISSGEKKQLSVEINTSVQEPVPEQSNVGHSDEVEQQNIQNNSAEEELNEEEHLDDEEDSEQDLNEGYLDQGEEEMDDISQTSDSMPPVPTNLVLSGGALNAHNIPLNNMFRQDEDDPEDEDCILGV